ncbi:MAG: BA14K family protein [Devosia sp.]
MVITPLVAAWVVGSFWTGVGISALHNDHDGRFGLGGSSDLVVSEDQSDHDALCAARYQSYDSDTGMYMSFGGKWKECTLGL